MHCAPGWLESPFVNISNMCVTPHSNRTTLFSLSLLALIDHKYTLGNYLGEVSK